MKIKQIRTEKELKDIYNYDFGVFSDTLDFDWTMEQIKKVKADGWMIYSVKVEKEIIAALFIRIDKERNALQTKNTPIKLAHQGHAYSDRIKDFYDKLAAEKGLAKVYHYCRIDDFRMVSLNEEHGYMKTGNALESNKQIIEWVKDLPQSVIDAENTARKKKNLQNKKKKL